MHTILILLHVFICLLLVLTILLQPGKTPGMGSAFGGASSAGSFGAKSPTTVLSKITVVIAVGFMLSSLTLAWMSVRDHSVEIGMDDGTYHPTPGLALPADDPVADEDVDAVDLESEDAEPSIEDHDAALSTEPEEAADEPEPLDSE